MLNTMKLPRPGLVETIIRKNLNVLLLSNSVNGLTRRIQNELFRRKIMFNQIETTYPREMERAVTSYNPDVIVCPCLTARIPESIYKHSNRPCLVVHPGIAGDRGASSIDWAIHDSRQYWGVTVLAANDVMDAGDIWSTANVPVRDNISKTSMYVGEITDAAADCVIDALSRFSQGLQPVPLDYSHSEVAGTFRRNVRHSDRKIDWRMPANEILTRVRMSDTQPGAIGQFGANDITLRMFDAHLETGLRMCKETRAMLCSAKPGTMVGNKNGSILMKSGDEHGVWIGQLKLNIGDTAIKLPATHFIQNMNSPATEISSDCDFDDIRVARHGRLCYVHFDFYNGAMDKYQATRLQRTLQTVSSRDDVDIVVLMGGDRFFSTGIHLNCIEASHDVYTEAWENINNINDVIHAISAMTNKLTVAALQGNAGAGGAILAAACDVVVAHPGVFLTPTYKAMNLFGSEYWTYFLPRRVGANTAVQLTQGTDTIPADQAQHIGLVDSVIGTSKAGFQQLLPSFVEDLLENGTAAEIIAQKTVERDADWFKMLQRHRQFELAHMSDNFTSEAFRTAMKRFVHKLKDDKEVTHTSS